MYQHPQHLPLTGQKLWQKLSLLPLLFLFLVTSNLQAQVIINEISGDGTVELKNLGNTTVNVSGYWLCDFPAYTQLVNLTPVCGTMNMAAGEILTVEGFTAIDENDAELGLYTSSAFGSATAIIDYVEWGSTGHTRSALAVSAGIWSTGAFLPSFASDQTLANDGLGDATSNWTTGVSSLCAENTATATTDGGTLTGGPFEFCVGDGVEDNVSGIVLTGNTGTNSQWIVTDDQGNILGLPPMPSAVNFDGAGTGICLIWHLSYEDGLTGLEAGMNAADLVGDFDISNSISVTRNQPEGGTLTGGPFEFTVGDGVADNIPAGAITLANAGGQNAQWVVTDANGIILGLPPVYTGPNFDGAGYGNCLIWHLSFEDGLVGAEVGLDANNLEGCFSLSNPITIVRNAADGCNTNGGELFGGPFEFTVGDGVADNIPAGAITLANAGGQNSQWVVTDANGIILGLPPVYTGPNFDGAGYGNCLIWHLSFEDGLVGAEVGLDANNLEGCFSLSNPITIVRNAADGCDTNGGELFGGPFEFTVGDGVADNIPAGAITLANAGGQNAQYIVTDEQGMILGLPPMPSAVDFDGAGAGVCLVWHLSYEDGLTGLEAGANAADLDGCFSLSNSITVTRNTATATTDGGTLTGGPFEFCVGDGVDDNVSGIELTGNTGTNSQWIVTDDQGNILGLPPMPSAVNFDGAGAGICLIWHLSYEDGLTGLEAGMNAADLVGDFDLSNSISVTRNQPEGGTLTGGPFEFTVGDGVADNIPAGAITLANAGGQNAQYIITDEQGMILGLPPMPSAVDFDGAGAGVCLVWHLSYEDGLTGLEAGANAADFEGCFSLSNSISVTRNAATANIDGGTLTGGPFEFCVGDGVEDNVSGIELTGNTGTNSQWIVTDDQGNILGLPPMPSAVNFDGAGTGICLIWHLSYEDGLTGLEAGMNTADLVGDFDLSNSISVTRNQPEGGTLTGGPFEFTVGDGVADNIPAGAITLANAGGQNSQYIITDEQGMILGLPPMPSAVDFDGAGAGVCLVWHLSYEDGLTGLEAGANAADLDGCFSLSNSISVTRNATASTGVDLNLDLQATNNLYDQFDNASFVFTVTNQGTETATNIEIDASFPEGLVYVSHFASKGSLELAWENWIISSLAPGESATLHLTLFALVDNQDIEYFTQVVAHDQADVDSTPDSSNGQVTEDDEASATITPRSQGGFGTNEGNIDLELSISTQNTTYDIYEVVRYRIEVKNNGSETATGVVVNAGLPQGMVFTNATVNNGEYNLYFEQWTIDFIGAGQTATLDLDLFTLVEGQDINNFVQIFIANEQDPDSTPGNSDGQVNEDDEAQVTLTYEDSLNSNAAIQSRSTTSKMMDIKQAYPNPATDFIMLPITSEIDLQTDVNIVDVSGRVVATQTMKVFEGFNRLNIDINHLSPGIYFISLSDLDLTSTNRRFIKAVK